jgi:hypothetical protein
METGCQYAGIPLVFRYGAVGRTGGSSRTTEAVPQITPGIDIGCIPVFQVTGKFNIKKTNIFHKKSSFL